MVLKVVAKIKVYFLQLYKRNIQIQTRFLVTVVATKCTFPWSHHSERRVEVSGWVKNPEATEWPKQSRKHVEYLHRCHGVLRSEHSLLTFLTLTACR